MLSVLGGSWVVTSGVISPLIRYSYLTYNPFITIVTLLITPFKIIVTLLMTPFITTHEPPSRIPASQHDSWPPWPTSCPCWMPAVPRRNEVEWKGGSTHRLLSSSFFGVAL